MPAPLDFHVAHGAIPSTLDVKAGRLVGAASYEVQLTQLDPLYESQKIAKIPAYLNLLVCQMVSLNRVQKLVNANMGEVIAESSYLSLFCVSIKP